ncbi:MAG: phosphoenolpyruvate carboxykinase (ATP) [Pelolinea sp.]|nr:phosphoenolpyruvate carboxykinase (ATP) [Pelolinea sp.]
MIINNPSYKSLKNIARKMPNLRLTEWDNYNIITRVNSRSPQSTFIVDDENSSLSTIDRVKYEEFAKLQDSYLEKIGALRIDGSIGISQKIRASASLFIEKTYPSIAAMQKQLFFPVKGNFKPDFKIVYTPNFPAINWPEGRCILVDLKNFTTRIAGTDYFGESKKAGLRMWNKWVYDRGGLALHAGCNTYTDNQKKEYSIIIIGLSGTGKTTTTFTPHSNSLPVQDDFCAFFPDGKIYASENGCFAKTFNLDPVNEPLIHSGLTKSNAWLENTFTGSKGRVDFTNDTHSTNGRGTFELDSIPHGNLHDISTLRLIFILNRNYDILPSIVKLTHAQAAAYFMLGETTGTSAGGNTEAGKALRIPGTNPFFPMNHTLQGNRFLNLLEQSPNVDVFLLNTGYIGGEAGIKSPLKVTIHHTKQLIESLLRNELKWEIDDDFGYLRVSENTSPVERIFIDPKEWYRRSERIEEYDAIKRKLICDRKDFLLSFKYLDTRIVQAI